MERLNDDFSLFLVVYMGQVSVFCNFKDQNSLVVISLAVSGICKICSFGVTKINTSCYI